MVFKKCLMVESLLFFIEAGVGAGQKWTGSATLSVQAHVNNRIMSYDYSMSAHVYLFSSSPCHFYQCFGVVFVLSVLRSRNYLFSAPAPTLAAISAPAPAPATAIYLHLKLF